ncbi:MAG: hypothetical protein LHV69_07825, partial [Elusimicrobia bacterium]|nr:hypothetical protein [Candidatus Obscuribacterium magneticum]
MGPIIDIIDGKTSRKFLAGFLSILLITSSLLTPWAQANPFTTVTKGPGQELENQEKDGFYNPIHLKDRLAQQQAVVREMKRREERQDYLKRKSLFEVLKNVQEAIQSKFANQEEFEAEMERRRKASAAIFGEGGLFTFVKYADGKKVWFKGGQVAKVENEKIMDAHGRTSIRNMDGMEYNGKGLLTSYQSSLTDPEGHTKTISWHGATYTEDSVAYGGEATPTKKLLTSYVEEITDDRGNKTTVEWKGATYNEKGQLTGYEQTSTDIEGRQTIKQWKDAGYDENGNLTQFNETLTDSFGLKTERRWSGGTYEKNPSFADTEKTPQYQAYLLKGYHEEVTDSRGQTLTKDWQGANYNSFGELTSYRETTQKTVNGKTLTQEVQWSDGQYNERGQLTSNKEQRTGFDGRVETKTWSGGTYDDRGRLLSYDETLTDDENNETRRQWQAGKEGGYDDNDRLLAYDEVTVDPLGNSQRKQWEGAVYDGNGRLSAFTEKTTDPQGNIKIRQWNTDEGGYDAFGEILRFSETLTDDLGNKTSRSWSDAQYDIRGNLIHYKEGVTDLRGSATQKSWDQGIYDELGRLTSYVETRTDADGNLEKTVWSNGRYDAKSRVVGYDENFTNAFGETRSKKWTATASDYDRYGNLLGYSEKIVDENGQSLIRQRQGSAYNKLGQRVRYADSITRTMHALRAPLSELFDSESIDFLSQEHVTVENIVWEGATYDRRNQLIGYKETTHDEAGRVQSKEWEGAYDDKSDLRYFKEKAKDVHGVEIETTWEGLKFDARGRATASQQIQTTNDDPGISYITNTLNRTYDRHGQVAGGLELTTTAGTSQDGRTVYVTRLSEISEALLQEGALTGYKQQTHTIGMTRVVSWKAVRRPAGS